jgi:hypothetical protein
VTNASLAALAAACSVLQSLALLRCPGVTDAGLAAFSSGGPAQGPACARGRALRGLTLHRCARVGATGLGAFIAEHAPRLRLLDVAAGGGEDAGFPQGVPLPAALCADVAAAAAAHCRGLQVRSRDLGLLHSHPAF